MRRTARKTAASGRCSTSARSRGARTGRSRPRARCARAAGSRRTRRRAAAPRARSGPKSTRTPTGCAATACASAAVAAKRESRRAELAQLCDDEGIEEGPADVKDAAFHTRYVVLNHKDDHKPYMRVRKGDEWKRACAVRGCVHAVEFAPGTPNMHCGVHGGGKCAHGRGWYDCMECNPNIARSAPIAARGALAS